MQFEKHKMSVNVTYDGRGCLVEVEAATTKGAMAYAVADFVEDLGLSKERASTVYADYVIAGHHRVLAVANN